MIPKIEATYYVKDNYGTEHWYPVNEASHFLVSVSSNKKTLGESTVSLARDFAFTFKEVKNPNRRR
tara:strand:- start:264 stop:461 length:198 start_codon:yes stop_codon:yes gene_type:complete